MRVCACVCVCERERDRQTDRQRDRDRQTDRLLSGPAEGWIWTGRLEVVAEPWSRLFGACLASLRRLVCEASSGTKLSPKHGQVCPSKNDVFLST